MKKWRLKNGGGMEGLIITDLFLLYFYLKIYKYIAKVNEGKHSSAPYLDSIIKHQSLLRFYLFCYWVTLVFFCFSRDWVIWGCFSDIVNVILWICVFYDSPQKNTDVFVLSNNLFGWVPQMQTPPQGSSSSPISVQILVGLLGFCLCRSSSGISQRLRESLYTETWGIPFSFYSDFFLPQTLSSSSLHHESC